MDHIIALREHLRKKIKTRTEEGHVELDTARIEQDE